MCIPGDKTGQEDPRNGSPTSQASGSSGQCSREDSISIVETHPDEFRSIWPGWGCVRTPALSADEEDVNVADEEETGSRSSALINKMKSLIKETPKKALKKKTAKQVQHRCVWFDSQGLKSSSAGQKTPKDKMPAKRSDKMHIDPPALAKLKANLLQIPAASTAISSRSLLPILLLRPEWKQSTNIRLDSPAGPRNYPW
ncbi:hypothetical protein PGT21_000240 [Puccinia graminis f. sp. tritici]|uniref:Uncharacterized protein n=1 Tax=Puccinia graminis f. sp. tritici TaxID=56615 RepID=A0A5B0M7B7_PUCGR|nr:hypothetical protein PGT21_000240 [Puccinia graminis f. sp. tritici]